MKNVEVVYQVGSSSSGGMNPADVIRQFHVG